MNSTSEKVRTASQRGFLNGVAALASLCSEWIGRSDVSVALYAKADFPDRFVKDYRIRRPLTLTASPETFKQTLVQWFGATPYRLTDHVVDLFEYELGKAQQVYRAADERTLLDDLSGSECGFGAYFFTEDVFFVAFAEHMLVFLMGSNE